MAAKRQLVVTLTLAPWKSELLLGNVNFNGYGSPGSGWRMGDERGLTTPKPRVHELVVIVQNNNGVQLLLKRRLY